MTDGLTFTYGRDVDILYVSTRAPSAEQESEALGDEVIAGLNPRTREVESLEVLFYSTRLSKDNSFDLPIAAALHLTSPA